MLNLTIHHNIHLTKGQRYALHNGDDIVTVGVSVPVWFLNKVTSEPAKEVFCNYYLSNPQKEVPIQILESGYEISLPHRKGNVLEMDDSVWRILLLNNPEKLDLLYRQTIIEVTSRALLDVGDGGSGCLFYREHNKIEKDDQKLSIMHFVSIRSMEKLVTS